MKHTDFDQQSEELLWSAGSAVFETDREYVRDLPVREHETIYSGKGAVPGRRAVCAMGRDIGLVRFMLFGESATTVLPEHDWGVVTVPLSISDPMHVNGTEFVPGEIFSWNTDNEYVGTGKDRHKITVPYRKSRMCAVLSALAGTQISPASLPSRIIQINPDTRSDLIAGLFAVLEGAVLGSPGNSGFYNLSEHQEQQLLDLVARSVFHISGHEVRVRPAISSERRVVENSLNAFEQHGYVPTVSDLCASADVGVTWLYKCFMEVYGVPPAQFILNKRLSAARERFLDRDMPPRSVKDVALSLGFDGPGRFAYYYRRAFGELPGQTLKRAAPTTKV